MYYLMVNMYCILFRWSYRIQPSCLTSSTCPETTPSILQRKVSYIHLKAHATFRLRYTLKLLKMCHIYPSSNRYQFYVNSGITYRFKWTTKLIKIKMATLKVNFQAGFFTQNFLYSIILLPILLLHCIIPKNKH